MQKSGWRHLALVGLAAAVGSACRGSSLWNTESTVDEVTETALNSAQGAQQAYLGALWQFTDAIYGSSDNNGVVFWSGLLADEYSDFFYLEFGTVDARFTADGENCRAEGGSCGEPGDTPLADMLKARSALLLTVPYLAANEQGTSASEAGEATALAGYAELYMAEDYCAGVPLSQSLVGGGFQFGVPLTTDSLLGVADTHFRQALTEAAGDTTVQNLASVGLGRALVDRGQYDSAAGAVTGVPTGFSFDLYFAAAPYASYPQASFYEQNYHSGCNANGINCVYTGYPEMANLEGGAGYDYLTAQDSRLVVNALGYSQDGFFDFDYSTTKYTNLPDSLWYWPVKFGPSPSTWSAFPLATGIEARMIMAEDTLQDDPGGLYPYLNSLRAQAADTYIGGGAVNAFGGDTTTCAGTTDLTCDRIFFREKAFWLYGLGNRLGDMRREERKPPLGYGLPDASVYPTGNYWYDPTDSAIAQSINGGRNQQGLWTYGSDVALTLPTAAADIFDANPNFKGGCLAGTTPATP